MKFCPFLPFALIVLASCSVKEDRKICPCILEVTTSIPDGGRIIDIAGFDDRGRFMFERMERKSFPSRYEKETKRCMMSVVCAISDNDILYSDEGKSVSVPKGMQADSLFTGIKQTDATGETAFSHVILHKQFSTINMSMEAEREDSVKYIIRVQSACAGLDVLSIKPVSGDFNFETAFYGNTSFRILRTDRLSDLTAILIDSDSGEELHDFAVGEMMSEAGYDCQADDLQDVDIFINPTDFSCTIRIKEWSRNIIIVDI